MGVLNAVSFDHLYLIADLDREVHAVYGIALFDLFQYTRIPFCELCGFIETFLHRTKKTVI
jgi:hypothetical protein